MSQNEEENVLTSTNSTNSSASESLSPEMRAHDPQELWSYGILSTKTDHDPQELSSYRPMPTTTDHDPQELSSYRPMPTTTDHDLQELSSYRPMPTMTDHDPQELSSYRPMPMMTDQDPQELSSYRPMPMMTDHDLQELSSYRPMLTMTDHDPQELSSYRPMPMDNGPQLSTVTWLMPIDPSQRLSPSTMMQFMLGNDPQLQSLSTWPMTYEPNQQPMTPSQYHTMQINYHPEMQPMPPLHQAVYTNNYHRQMQPIPPSHDAVQINNYRRQIQLMPLMIANGGIPSTPTPWIGSIVPHNPSFLHCELCSFNPNAYYDDASSALQQCRGVEENIQLVEPRLQVTWSPQQQRRSVEEIQFEDPRSLQGSQPVLQPQSCTDRCCTLGRRPGLPSLQQQQRGVEENIQLAEPRSLQGSQPMSQPQSCADRHCTLGRRPGLPSLQQQQRGVEEIQFEDPRSLQGSQPVLQPQSCTDRCCTLGRRPGLPSLQQQQRGVEENIQLAEPRSLQGSQPMSQPQSCADRHCTLGRRPGLPSLQQQQRGVEEIQFEDPRSLQGSQPVLQPQSCTDRCCTLGRRPGLPSLQQQQRGVEENIQLAEPRSLQGSQPVSQPQSCADRRCTLGRRPGLPSLQQQQRGVEENIQLVEPRSLQGSQPVSQMLQLFPADRINTLGRRQRPWTTFFQHSRNAAAGRTTAMECRQLNGTIRFCATCNALWPANGQPPATHGENNSCKVTALLLDKCVPLFECYMCNVRIRMQNLSYHLVTARHDEVPDKDGEQYLSFFCDDCNRVLYAPLHVFVKHRQSLHSTGVLDISVPSRLYMMYALMLDFERSGRDIMLYACMSCMYMSSYSHNRTWSRCAVCAQPQNRYYCQHCNVVFYALQADYDMHRFTFEHFYFMYHRWLRSNAAVQPVDVGNTGGGRGRGGGRAPARAARGRGRGRGRGRAVDNGVTSASEQS